MTTLSTRRNPGPWFSEPGWGGAALLLAVTFLAYIPALQGGYVWDDDDFVTGNVLLKSGWNGLWRLWFDLGATDQYYPLTYSSFWLEYQIWGFSATGSHFINVLLHGLNAVLFWKALRVLRVPGAALAAFVFALHPVEVESAAWITERKNVLSGAFYLSAFLAYWRFQMPPGAREAPGQKGRWYAAALLLFLCALCSKSVTCTLPAALLVMLWWKKDRLRARDLLPLLPFFVLGAGYAVLTAAMEKQFVGAVGREWHLTFPERFLIAGRALWFYADKLLWPAELIFNYPRWTPDAGVWWQWLFPAVALALAAALWGFRKRWGKGPATAIFYFTLTLFPALGFVDVFPFRYSFVADHFQYLASLGPIALAAAGLARMREIWKPSAWLARLFCIVLLGVLAALTWRQCGAYAGLETFYRAILAKNPASWLAHDNISVVLLDKGAVDESVSHSRRAMVLNPDDAKAYVNLGNALVVKGKLDDAIASYKTALRLRPNFPEACSDMGNALLFQGKLDEAIAQYRRAIALKPDYAEAQNNLGYAFLQKGKPGEALPFFQKALALKPDYPQAQANLEHAQQALPREENKP